MAKIDLENITESISDEQPCGPDLDMEFDMDFMNFIAEIEGLIPTRYFSFDSATLSFDTYYGQIGEFLERTRDIRILVPLAKLKILQSDLDGFTDTVDAIHRLLQERWADVHPQPGDFLELSMGQLSTLDDMPNVILPLQHTPITRSRRSGPITLRKWQIANGDVNPREGEDLVDLGTLTGALAEADADELATVNATLERARDAVAGIRLVCIGEAGYEQAPVLEKLPEAIEGMLGMIVSVTGAAEGGADPDADSSDAGSSGAAVMVTLPAGAVASREEAVEAIHAAAHYFALKEPSSPVPMLLREAEKASSKGFYELMNDLVPDAAASAQISLGKEPWFDVSLYTLDARNPAPDYETDADDSASSWEDAGLEDEVSDDGRSKSEDAAGADPEGEAVVEDGAIPDDGEIEASPEVAEAEAEPSADNAEPVDEGGDVDTGDRDSADGWWGESSGDSAETPEAPAKAASAASAEPGGTPKYTAQSRPEAIALLEKVTAYYRVAEPTSPIPLLIDRAIEISSQSFMEILQNVLPDGSLQRRQMPDESGGDNSW